MPTRYLSRTFCKTCQDYKLFENKICQTCDNEYVPYRMSEVPENVIEPQRERWQNRKRNTLQTVLHGLATDFHSTTIGTTEIHEDDAGLQWIIDERRKRISEERKQKEEEIEKYKNVGRNELCTCGSGKKFKKCHYLIISQ